MNKKIIIIVVLVLCILGIVLIGFLQGEKMKTSKFDGQRPNFDKERPQDGMIGFVDSMELSEEDKAKLTEEQLEEYNKLAEELKTIRKDFKPNFDKSKPEEVDKDENADESIKNTMEKEREIRTKMQEILKTAGIEMPEVPQRGERPPHEFNKK